MSLPHRLGRLQRISRIGSGGFATVWLYSDPDLQSRVAVKALADNWSSRTDIRERFLEEARILRRADSDNVVRVYDLGETDDGTPYFVMNYADRGTVADLLNTPSRDLPMIADLVAQASTGLKRLHSMGILHRDVKPQNLLLSGDPSPAARRPGGAPAGSTRLMVADLGVAKAMLHASGITQVVGTPAYMAPEQADPTRPVDARCDVHALGAVAYHLVTGRAMRTGGFESLFAPDPIRPPTALVPDLPTSLDQVLLRAVAYDPEQRWPDIDTFGTAFAEAATASHTQFYAPPRVEAQVWQPGRPTPPQDSPALDSPPPQSPVPPPRTPAPRDVRAANRRRSWLAVVAAVAVVAVVLGATIAWQELRDDPGDSVTAPDIDLGASWEAPEGTGESQWKYLKSDNSMELLVSTGTSAVSVEEAADDYQTDQLADGFTVDYEGMLSDKRRGPWQSGWDLRYHGKNDDGEKVYFWRWYFGNAVPQTAGYVEIRGTDKGLSKDPDAEAALAQAREDAIIGEDGTESG